MVTTATRPQLDTATLTGVEVLAVGRWNGDLYSASDLADMASAFAALKGKIDPPGKLGHDGEQNLAQRDGYPAIGWVTNLYVQGDKLLADFDKMPRKVADLVQAGAYNKVSSEVYFDREIDGTTYPRVLKAVAFLGADAPAVKDIKSISDVADLYEDTLPAAEAHYAEYDHAKNYDYGDDLPPTTVGAALEARIHQTFTDTADGFRRMSVVTTEERIALSGAIGAALKTFLASAPADVMGRPISGAMASSYYGDDGDEESMMAEFDGYCQKLEDRIKGVSGARTLRTFLTTTRRHLADMKLKPASKENTPMDSKKLTEALGLPETATEAEILTSIEAAKKPAEYSDDVRKLTDDVGKLTRELAERDAREAVGTAMREGKILPAQKEWAESYAIKDPDGFKSYAEAAPKNPVLKVFGHEHPTEADASELTDSEKAAVADGRVSEESMKRAKSGVPTHVLLEEERRKAAKARA